MCIFQCSSSLISWKHLSHWLHYYGFSPICILWCIIRWFLMMNHLSLVAMIQFFWSLCFLVFLTEQNIFHTAFIDMVSPQWVFSVVLLDLLSKQNIFSHCLHWYGFSPMSILCCSTRLTFQTKHLSHRLHIYTSSPQYVFFGDGIELMLCRIFTTLVALIWILPIINSLVFYKITF